MLRDITIGQHFPGNSLVHRFDPRLKLVLTIVYIVMLFAASNPLGLTLSILFLAVMYRVAKIPLKMIGKSLKPILPIVIFTAVLNLFFVSGEGEPLVHIWFLTIYAEGVRYAVLMAVRVMALIAGTSLLTYTTSPIVLTDAIEQLLKPLGKLHFPVHELAMMMSIALRFIPTLIEETDKIMNAQKARGAQLDTGKMTERVKALVPVLIPLFISAFRRADELAMAMECRCYRGGDKRTRLREMMNGIDPGQGLGVIVRTVSAGTTKTTLKNDLQYLKRVWKDIRKKATEVSAPALIYQEPGLPQRAVRDYLTDDVCEIWVDNEEVADSIRETVSLLFPRKKELVRLHTDVRMPLWERFSLRRQLDQIYSREVTLPSGGRLVFDQTEALMAVDINSGKISGKVNFESMAHRTNMEAAEAIARQLKLRDIGGQVVIDFIEMRDKKHVLEVEKTLRTAMKNDRARHDVGRMSSFGLLELVRQRTGSSALSITMEPCPFCGAPAQLKEISGRWAVECTKHCAGTRIFNDKDKPIEAWNRRESDEQIH